MRRVGHQPSVGRARRLEPAEHVVHRRRQLGDLVGRGRHRHPFVQRVGADRGDPGRDRRGPAAAPGRRAATPAPATSATSDRPDDPAAACVVVAMRVAHLVERRRRRQRRRRRSAATRSSSRVGPVPSASMPSVTGRPPPSDRRRSRDADSATASIAPGRRRGPSSTTVAGRSGIGRTTLAGLGEPPTAPASAGTPALSTSVRLRRSAASLGAAHVADRAPPPARAAARTRRRPARPRTPGGEQRDADADRAPRPPQPPQPRSSSPRATSPVDVVDEAVAERAHGLQAVAAEGPVDLACAGSRRRPRRCCRRRRSRSPTPRRAARAWWPCRRRGGRGRRAGRARGR